MKSIFLISIYVGTFMFFFMALSLIGLLWNDTYLNVISDGTWFMMYTLFLGWWVSIFPTREYYMLNEQYFDEVF